MTRTSVTLLQKLSSQSDAQAWERFVDIYGPFIYRWLRKAGLQDHDAQDVGQEVMLAVVQEMPEFRYDPTIGTFRSWLRTVIGRQALMFWRAKRKKSAAALADDIDVQLEEIGKPDSIAASRWNEEHNKFVLARGCELVQTEFEAKTWSAFVGVVLDGREPATVATDLGISTNAVYVAKSRVLRRLKEVIAEYLD